MSAELPHEQRKNSGLAEIEQYRDCPLPEDYEITNLLGDVIMCEFEDETDKGEVVRNGIVLPSGIAETRAWRIGRVKLAGPDTRWVKAGDVVIFPNDKGLPAIQRSGKKAIFLNEQRIFGICSKVDK